MFIGVTILSHFDGLLEVNGPTWKGDEQLSRQSLVVSVPQSQEKSIKAIHFLERFRISLIYSVTIWRQNSDVT